MINGKEILTVSREIWMQSPPQPNFEAVVTEVKENIFWTNLPREGNRVLLLNEKQSIKVGVSLRMGFYQNDTIVEAVGNDNNKFYGMTIPTVLNKLNVRRYIRANYTTTVYIKTKTIYSQTTLVNFSAGGIMVYLVPKLEEILRSGQRPIILLNIDNYELKMEIRPVWQRLYSNVPFAGFEFVDISPNEQDILAQLANKYHR